MSDLNIETYTDTYKDRVANLILNIQDEEFEIPITLAQQPDLNTISAFYQVGKGNFWIAKMDDQVIGTIALLDIGNNQGALRKCLLPRPTGAKRPALAKPCWSI